MLCFSRRVNLTASGLDALDGLLVPLAETYLSTSLPIALPEQDVEKDGVTVKLSQMFLQQLTFSSLLATLVPGEGVAVSMYAIGFAATQLSCLRLLQVQCMWLYCLQSLLRSLHLSILWK